MTEFKSAPFFVPRIGKEKIEGIEGIIGDLPFENLYRIATHHPYIAKSELLDAHQQVSNAGAVYLDANIVIVRMVIRDLG